MEIKNKILLALVMLIAVLSVQISTQADSAQKLTLSAVETAEFPTIEVKASVTDSNQRTVPGLDAGFVLQEEGQSLTAVRVKAPEKNSLSVAVVMDSSYALRNDATTMHSRAQTFLEQLYPQDRSLLLEVKQNYRLLQELDAPEASRNQLKNLKAESQPERLKILHDGLMQAITELAKGPPAERVVLVFSDGEDRGSSTQMADVVAKAKGYGVKIHTLLYGKLESSAMRRLALSSGGKDLFNPTAPELKKLYQLSVMPLREPYQLSYDSPDLYGAQSRQITLQLKEPTLSSTLDYTPPAEKLRFNWFLPALVLGLLLVLGFIASLFFRKKPLPPIPAPAPVPAPAREPKPAPAPPKKNKLDPVKIDPSHFNLDVNPNPTKDTHIAAKDLPDLEEHTMVLRRKRVATDQGHFIIVQASRRPQILTLSAEKTATLGRSKNCDLVIQDETVSREHAKVRYQEGAFYLYDLGSSGGTRINQNEIVKQSLSDGDKVELGEVQLIFKWTRMKPLRKMS